MKIQRGLHRIALSLAASLAFAASLAANAQNLIVDVVVKAGDKTVHTSSIEMPLDKQTEVQAGIYKISVLATLVAGSTTEEIRLEVRTLSPNLPPMATAQRGKLGKAFKVFNGMRDQEIELTPRLK